MLRRTFLSTACAIPIFGLLPKAEQARNGHWVMAVPSDGVPRTIIRQKVIWREFIYEFHFHTPIALGRSEDLRIDFTNEKPTKVSRIDSHGRQHMIHGWSSGYRRRVLA